MLFRTTRAGYPGPQRHIDLRRPFFDNTSARASAVGVGNTGCPGGTNPAAVAAVLPEIGSISELGMPAGDDLRSSTRGNPLAEILG